LLILNEYAVRYAVARHYLGHVDVGKEVVFKADLVLGRGMKVENVHSFGHSPLSQIATHILRILSSTVSLSALNSPAGTSSHQAVQTVYLFIYLFIIMYNKNHVKRVK